MKNIAFTICSNNYLAQAKVLSDSVYEHSHETYEFYIVLCDVFDSRINYDAFHAKFIEAKELKIDNFEWMIHFYNIIELNTAIKPFVFKYLYQNSKAEYIHYFDPDTCTYHSLNIIEDELFPDYSILLTPHAMESLPFDGKRPTDNTFLNNGVFNLGFLGTRRSDETDRMLNWWCDFLSEHCVIDSTNGFFVDQLPMTLVPCFYDKVKICKNKGINAAYWNLHERVIGKSDDNNTFLINGKTLLVMYHFSNYKKETPQNISSYYNRSSFNDNPILLELFMEYNRALSMTDWHIYRKIQCVYSNTNHFNWLLLCSKLLNRISRDTHRWANKIKRFSCNSYRRKSVTNLDLKS